MDKAESSQPPEGRFCDLVMKGGITSGVVYPKAIARLAKEYRFKSIGGTSAGAIAAAATAAAEYQRRHTGSNAGFERLAELPKELSDPVAGTDKSTLLSLFQPLPQTRRLFNVLLSALNRSSTNMRVAAIVWGFLRAYWPATFAALLVAGVLGTLAGWIAGLLMAVVATIAAVGAWVYRDVTKHLVANDFGLCTGLTTPDSGTEALVPWLHALIQEAAGRTVDDPPLTFGDLWGAPGFPPAWLSVRPGTTQRSIDLQMFATNVTHGRPYVFPLVEETQSTPVRTKERLFFKPGELERFMPPSIVRWMCQQSQPYRLEPGREGLDPPEADAEGRRELPAGSALPIVFVARLSLSFPLLFAAVPLSAINHDEKRGHRRFETCWFADGGISSNFPMHLFDGLVPLWPTFGITLEPALEGRPLVYLPQKYGQGYGERWYDFGRTHPSVSSLGGFLSAIVSSMQNWNDNTLARMPGVRDRVVRLRLKDGEGGMNLNMPKQHIGEMADRGLSAAEALIAKFVPTPGSPSASLGWDDHRMVRLSLALKMLNARATGVVGALAPGRPHTTDYSDLVERALREAAPGYEKPLTEEQAAALRAEISALKAYMISTIDTDGAKPFTPVPRPELRVRPPL